MVGFGVMITLATVFLLIGWLIKDRKAYFLISGYNTMGAERRKQVDVEGLAAHMAMFCRRMAAVFGVAGLLVLLGQAWAIMGAFLLLLPFVGYFIVTVQRFDRGALNANGTYRGSTKVVVGIVLGVLAAVMVFVGVMTQRGSQPAEVWVTATGVDIGGMYGVDLRWNEIRRVELVVMLPKVLARTNGFAMGDARKGHFRLQGVGKARLFVVNNEAPFIRIDTAGERFYLNMKDPGETRRVYDSIMKGR